MNKFTRILVFFFFLTLAPRIRTEGGAVVDNVTSLFKKYSSVKGDYLNKKQLQELLDNLQKCSNSFNETSLGNLPKSDCRSVNECNGSEECLSAEFIFNVLDIRDDRFGTKSLVSVCPLILSHLESRVCSEVKFELSSESADLKRPTPFEVWGLGFLFVTMINSCSLLGVIFLPLMDKAFYKQLLMVLIGLAVGSLSASSVFHLIPQAFQLADKDKEHKYLNISFMLWAGIWAFYMTERIMKIIKHARNNLRAQTALPCKNIPTEVVSAVSSPTELLPGHELENQSAEGCMLSRYDYQEQLSLENHDHHICFEQGKDSVIATVAWMIIFGDGLHNFIDGLSIGAAFNQSILTGIGISIAVLCEELPHELGDFAVLLKAGMTMRQALVYNFLSAGTCYFGLILGILLGDFEASSYIFGFAAGMFMYISLVDMMPELNEAAEDASKISVKTAVKTLTLQNIGLISGVVALYVLARFQDSITFA